MSEWAAQVCRGHYKSKICIFSQISTKWNRFAYKLSSKSSPFWRLILSFFLYQKKLTATEIVTRLVVLAPMRGIHGSVYKFYGEGGNLGGGFRGVDICSKLWVCFVCLAWLYIDHLVSLSFLARSLIIFNWVRGFHFVFVLFSLEGIKPIKEI